MHSAIQVFLQKRYHFWRHVRNLQMKWHKNSLEIRSWQRGIWVPISTTTPDASQASCENSWIERRLLSLSRAFQAFRTIIFFLNSAWARRWLDAYMQYEHWWMVSVSLHKNSRGFCETQLQSMQMYLRWATVTGDECCLTLRFYFFSVFFIATV